MYGFFSWFNVPETSFKISNLLSIPNHWQKCVKLPILVKFLFIHMFTAKMEKLFKLYRELKIAHIEAINKRHSNI